MAQYQSALTGPEIDAALQDMAQHDSEAWAVGQRDGVDVGSLDITYHNNAEYYAETAQGAAARAESAVPAGTSGAVFFDIVQTLTDAQKAQARTNIGAQGSITDALQLNNSLGIASAEITTTPVQTGGAGWYRVATINLTRGSSEGQVFHCSGLLFLGGFYSGYKPSKGVFSFTYDGGSTYANIVQLGGVASTSPTQIRISNTEAASELGQGWLVIDFYYSSTAFTRETVSVIVGGARAAAIQTPALITGTPTGETVRATLTISTIKTGAVNKIQQGENATGISSLAALKNQMTTWWNALPTSSLGYYTISLSGTISPFPTGAHITVEIARSDYSNYGTATIKNYTSAAGASLYMMSMFNGSWTDPVKVN